METKLKTLFDCVKTLSESDLDRIIEFVLGIFTASATTAVRPDCPICNGQNIIKFGNRIHKGKKKQRFMCKDCRRTFMHTTNTLLQNSHFERSVWIDFIRDTICGVSLDKSAEKYHFSHQTAFNMRHKILMALEDWFDANPTKLSKITELDETFVLESFKGSPVPESAGRKARKHGAKAQKPGISSEYVAICTGIQRDGNAIAKSVNRAKPSSEEVLSIYNGHIAEDTLILTDGLRSYNILKDLPGCTVKDVNYEDADGMLNLNTINSMHSYIKGTYDHYRGVATKYLNRYNALFSIAFRCSKDIVDNLFASWGNTGTTSYWHSTVEIRQRDLLCL